MQGMVPVTVRRLFGTDGEKQVSGPGQRRIGAHAQLRLDGKAETRTSREAGEEVGRSAIATKQPHPADCGEAGK